MQSAQQRILDAIERLANDHGIECAKSSDFANTGQVHLYQPGQTAAFGSVGFNFQTASYTLNLTVNGRKVPSQPGRSDYFDFYQSYQAPSAFWDTLKREMAPFRGPAITPTDDAPPAAKRPRPR
jgi:hypothetical protein